MKPHFVFSEAFDANGEWVHVDNVPRGEKCNCYCPTCHEKLKACQGPHPEKRSHGFAHCSEKRGANLKICYYVNLYKRAESIIKEEKCIYAPSYYGIYGANVIRFKDVQIDSRYEREDKQPDVIATTEDGEQYLIEFVFRYKVQHKKALDYGNLTCLEVDLSNQSFETLRSFLLSSNEDRKWLNNETYFKRIEETYQKANKPIRVVPEEVCMQCEFTNQCVAAKHKDSTSTLVIENSGRSYRLCKTEAYQELLRLKEQEKQREKEREERRRIAWEERLKKEREKQLTPLPISERTCWKCENNLDYLCKNSTMAHCGIYKIVGLSSPRVNPEYAKECRPFREKD